MKQKKILTYSNSAKFQLMTQELPVQPSNTPAQPAQANRDLSWQVAHNLFLSFKYAGAGISYAFATQRNFRIHVVIGSLALSLGGFLHLEAVKLSVIGLTIGLVLALELLNTALESVVDITVQQNFHPLAKIAKDCAAGAVLVSALAAVMVAGSLILPPLAVFLQTAIGS